MAADARFLSKKMPTFFKRYSTMMAWFLISSNAAPQDSFTFGLRQEIRVAHSIRASWYGFVEFTQLVDSLTIISFLLTFEDANTSNARNWPSCVSLLRQIQVHSYAKGTNENEWKSNRGINLGERAKTKERAFQIPRGNGQRTKETRLQRGRKGQYRVSITPIYNEHTTKYTLTGKKELLDMITVVSF